jgi:hypothetical protein
MSNLRGLVNLADTNTCLFAGYWLTEAMVRPAGREMYASAYINPNLRTAALLFFNGDKQEQSLAGTVLDLNAILPGSRGRQTVAARIFDLESGAPVQVTAEPGHAVFAEPVPVGGHNFRLIGIVAE